MRCARGSSCLHFSLHKTYDWAEVESTCKSKSWESEKHCGQNREVFQESCPPPAGASRDRAAIWTGQMVAPATNDWPRRSIANSVERSFERGSRTGENQRR